jgi:hypothetical protein
MKSNHSAERALTLLDSEDVTSSQPAAVGADAARTRARGGRQPDPLAQALRRR